jgi:hypothetical protein
LTAPGQPLLAGLLEGVRSVVSKFGCMKKSVLFLMAALGLTMSALSTQAAQVVITDLMNNQLNSNKGGGNQHPGSGNPVYDSPDVARITIQRTSFNGESYVVVWQGVVDKNQNPPANAVRVSGSDTTLSNPPNLDIDFSTLLLNGIIPPPVDSTTVYSIAVISVNNGGHVKTEVSAQFNFPNLNSQCRIRLRFRLN